MTNIVQAETNPNQKRQTEAPPTASLSERRRKDMLEEGWDLDAWDASFTDAQESAESEEEEEIPIELLAQGFHASAAHPFFGYIVDIWLHEPGTYPYRLIMRPRYAEAMASALEQVASNTRAVVPTITIDTDFGESIAIKRRGRQVIVATNGFYKRLTKSASKAFVCDLREAAAAHTAVH